jgi:cyclophilin family peptidyl-prolyl cis-trans isomerase
VNQSGKTFTDEIRAMREQELQSARMLDEVRRSRSENFGKIPEDVPEPLKTEYSSALDTYRVSVGRLNRLFLEHNLSRDSTDDIRRLYAFSDALDSGQKSLVDWRTKIAEVFSSSLADKFFMRELILDMLEREFEKERFDGMLPIVSALWIHEPDLNETVLSQMAAVAVAENDLALAEAVLRRLETKKTLKRTEAFWLRSMPDLKERFRKEESARRADATRDDNPRVALMTNKGRLTVELFENEAPQAVASFIHLVEKRFYDRKTFFRVVEGFGAQTGCDRGDGTGDAGYQIRGEMDLPDHRCVFRGSLVLLSATDETTGQIDRDSGSSQFAIAAMPQLSLDGKQTVFGRVVEGLHVLGSLKRIDLTKEEERKNKKNIPDILVEARVIRKREHPYLPEPVSGQLR